MLTPKKVSPSDHLDYFLLVNITEPRVLLQSVVGIVVESHPQVVDNDEVG